MASLEILTGRNYLSYSSLTSWLDCGERFRLERVLNAPQSPAWWFIAGDAIHKATEALDRGEGDSPHAEFTRYFDEALTAVTQDGLPKSDIQAGGRKTKDFPNKEDESYWRLNGPSMVANWVTWRDRMFNAGWQWFQLPDGSSAIEVPIQVEFDDVLVKGYIDRVMVNDDGEAVVVDLKSGSRVPVSTLQLGIYALGMSRNFGITPTLGGYYMTRQGEVPELNSLLHYTHETVGNWFSAAKRGIEAEVFIPHVGMFCGSCSVAKYCTAVGGDPRPLVNASA